MSAQVVRQALLRGRPAIRPACSVGSGASGARFASVILIVAQAVVAFWAWKRWRSHGGRRIEALKDLSTDEKIRYSNAR
jgi:hypothetical protein